MATRWWCSWGCWWLVFAHHQAMLNAQTSHNESEAYKVKKITHTFAIHWDFHCVTFELRHPHSCRRTIYSLACWLLRARSRMLKQLLCHSGASASTQFCQARPAPRRLLSAASVFCELQKKKKMCVCVCRGIIIFFFSFFFQTSLKAFIAPLIFQL